MVLRSPRVQLCFVAFLWGISFPIMKLLLANIGVFQILAIRFGIAGCFLLFISKSRRFSRQSLWLGSKLAFFLFSGYAFQTWGLKYTTATHASFIVGTVVVFVAIMDVLFKSFKPPDSLIFRILLMLVGLGLLTKMDLNVAYFGDLLQVLAAVLFAIQIFFISDVPKSSNFIDIATVQMFAVALFSLAVGIFFESPGPNAWGFSFSGWLALALMGVFATGWTFLAQINAQQKIKPTETAVLLAAEPMWGFAASILVLHEGVTAFGILGGVLILVSSIPILWRD